MAKKQEPTVVVKKVNAYPFPAQFTRSEGEAGTPIVGQVVKITQIGFMVEFTGTLPLVGDSFLAEFKLPTFKLQHLVKVRIVKTYHSFRLGTGPDEAVTRADSADEGSAPKPVPQDTQGGEEKAFSPVNDVLKASDNTVHLAEMHFVKQSLTQKQDIVNWINTVKQAEK